VIVNDFQDFFLFFRGDSDYRQGFTDAAIRANEALTVGSGKGRGFVVGCPAKGAHSGNFGLVCGLHNLSLHTIVYCLNQATGIEIEKSVPLSTNSEVIVAGFSKRTVLVHNVGEGSAMSNFAGSDTGDIKFEVFLVIEVREAFVAVEVLFIAFRYFPNGNRYVFASLGLDG
jgi:hypothetical protein